MNLIAINKEGSDDKRQYCDQNQQKKNISLRVSDKEKLDSKNSI